MRPARPLILAGFVLMLAATTAAHKSSPAVAKQIERLKSDDAKVRCEAARALMILRPRTQDAIGALTEALGDESQRVRFTAAQALGSIGPQADAAADALAAALKDEKDAVRWNAAAALAKIRPGGGKAVYALTKALKDNNIQVRRYAADALGAIGRGARPSADALTAMLKDKEVSARLSAAEALAKLGEGKRAVDTLAAALKHDDLYSRRRAAEILEIIGPDARGVAPALLHAVNDADGWLTPKVAARAAAARALGVSEKVLRDEAIPFQNDNWIVRWRAARALGKIDPQTATDKVVPVLIEMLNHKQPWMRQMSVETLGAIGEPARAAIPALKVILANDKSEAVWRGAHKALELIRAGEATTRPTTRPAVKLAPTHVWCQGGLVLRAYDRQHGIIAAVPVPRKLLKALDVPVSSKLKQGKAIVSYYRGKRIDNLLAPSGAPFPPSGVGGTEYETQKALSGSVTVTPLPGGAIWQKVEVTFKDLVFKGFKIKKIGPLKAQLGLTPPP